MARHKPETRHVRQHARHSRPSGDSRRLLIVLRLLLGFLPKPKEAGNLAHHVRVRRFVADIDVGKTKIKA